MAEMILRAGSRSAQGLRSNNEDRFVVDLQLGLFVVADGMGGQDKGEVASGMAVDIIPRAVEAHLKTAPGDKAVRSAFAEAHTAIVQASEPQPVGKRMGTTAVCALYHGDHVYIGNLGDSRAYLIREKRVEMLTADHSMAYYWFQSGALTLEEARTSPYQNVLYKFLGCSNLQDDADIKPYTPEPGDRLILGSDGLTNFLTEEDMVVGVEQFTDPQLWMNHLVDAALARGSRDNVTGIAIFFDAKSEPAIDHP